MKREYFILTNKFRSRCFTENNPTTASLPAWREYQIGGGLRRGLLIGCRMAAWLVNTKSRRSTILPHSAGVGGLFSPTLPFDITISTE